VLVSNVGQCINIASDVRQIQQIANQRSSELSQVGTLRTNRIPNGATLKSQLMRALKISLMIDNNYLRWAQEQQNSGCTVGTDSTYYQQATALNGQATSDKEIFAAAWNPNCHAVWPHAVPGRRHLAQLELSRARRRSCARSCRWSLSHRYRRG